MNNQTAERLYKYRKANGYSQSEIADMLGVSRQAVSKWERGESSPDTDNLIALAKLYNITIDEMINGSSQPQKTAPSPAAENTYTDYSYQQPQPAEQSDNNQYQYHYNQNYDQNNRNFDNNMNKQSNSGLHTILPLFAVAFYLFVGLTTDDGWKCGWLIFFIIPIAETLYKAIKTKNPSVFAYPVFAAGLYLTIGMLFNVWHPTWLVFITIPIYYILANTLKQLLQTNRSQSTASIIFSTVISSIIIIMIIVSCIIGLLKIPSGSITANYNEDEYMIAQENINIDDNINNIDIEWISGNIDIEYYDENTISFSESGVYGNDNYKMRYKVSNSTLYIEYCKSGFGNKLHKLSKNITIFLPKGKELSNVDISTVSADVNINQLTVKNSIDFDNVSGNINADGKFSTVDFDNVSGDINITGSEITQEIDGSTVSGNCKISFPEENEGFSINYDAISGNVSSDDFDGYKSHKSGELEHSYGSGKTNISVSSVSGNLYIVKK